MVFPIILIPTLSYMPTVFTKRIAQEKSAHGTKRFPEVSRLEKLEDLVADGDIIAGDCDGETPDTSGRSLESHRTDPLTIIFRLTLTRCSQLVEEDGLASSVRLRVRPGGREDWRCLSWAGDDRPGRADTAHLNIHHLEKWGSRKGGMV